MLGDLAARLAALLAGLALIGIFAWFLRAPLHGEEASRAAADVYGAVPAFFGWFMARLAFHVRRRGFFDAAPAAVASLLVVAACPWERLPLALAVAVWAAVLAALAAVAPGAVRRAITTR
jgi:hypothetical protein